MLLVILPILIPAIKRQLKKPEFTDADMFVDFVSNDLFKDLELEKERNESWKYVANYIDKAKPYR